MSRVQVLAGLLVVALFAAMGGLWYRDVQEHRRSEDLLRRFACQVGLAPVMPMGEGAPPVVELAALFEADTPVAVTTRPGDDALWVTEKSGRVLLASPPEWEPRVALDLRDVVRSTALEQGLLGIVFSPDGEYLYVDYTALDGDTHVTEFAVSDGTVDASSRRDVLVVDQPRPDHNGGHLLFGPDGLLYIGLGDGGGATDPDDNGQDLGSLLGKILRIDPRPEGDRAYRVPPDNPFVNRDGARPEIWLYGVRNPWRFSFHPGTGDLWVGDVGDGCFEEITVVPAGEPGANLGWDRAEGPWVVNPPEPPGHLPPRFAYERSLPPCAVVGGHVYRGSRIPELRGEYVFGDFCANWLSALPGAGDGNASYLGPVPDGGITAVGEDANGELYVLSVAGVVYRVDPAAQEPGSPGGENRASGDGRT